MLVTPGAEAGCQSPRHGHVGHARQLSQQRVLSGNSDAQRIDLVLHRRCFLPRPIELIAHLPHLLGHVCIRSGVSA